MFYLEWITWSIVNEKELPVCGTPPDTVVSLGHEPCDSAETECNLRKEICLKGALPCDRVTHENSCLGRPAPFRPYS